MTLCRLRRCRAQGTISVIEPFPDLIHQWLHFNQLLLHGYTAHHGHTISQTETTNETVGDTSRSRQSIRRNQIHRGFISRRNRARKLLGMTGYPKRWLSASRSVYE